MDWWDYLGLATITDDAGRSCDESCVTYMQIRAQSPSRSVMDQVQDQMKVNNWTWWEVLNDLSRIDTSVLNTGHTWLANIKHNRQDIAWEYGFYPASTNYFGGPGAVLSDSGETPTHTSGLFSACPETMNIVRRIVLDDRNSPPTYHLFDQQCTTWASGVLT